MASSVAMPNTATTTTEAESTKKRRNTEIKKVQQPNKRHVTFSKRKLGLFNKLTELSILCQTETALIITSENGNHYSSGYPNADAVIRRYLTGGPPQCKKKERELVETLRVEYEAKQKQLQEEKKLLEATKKEQKKSSGSNLWWELSVEDMDLDNLEQFKGSLELLKLGLVSALQKKLLTFSPMPLAIAPPPPQLPNTFTHCFNGHQVQDSWSGVSNSSYSLTRGDFGLYN